MEDNKNKESKLKALILTGGKSIRMGEDKASIQYGKFPQAIQIAEICKSLGIDVFISVKHSYNLEKFGSFNALKDTEDNIGPLGGILAAFDYDESCAWLVLACDLPFLDEGIIRKLINCRDKDKIATAFQGVNKTYPEPLATIYEPHACNYFKRNFKQMNFKVLDVLLTNEYKSVPISNDKIRNINTPEEKEIALQELKGPD